jgi:phosphotransferase system HPr (HPr) family protein
MPNNKAVRRVKLSNAHGLHMRPASRICAEAQRFPCDIRISCGDRHADAKSILSLFSLLAECGSELVIEAHGLDSKRAAKCLQELVLRQFLLSDSKEIAHAVQHAKARPD